MTDRPVRNVVKISHVDETSFMDDINDVHNLAKAMMNHEVDVQNLDNKPRTDEESRPNVKADDLYPDNQEYFDDEVQGDVFDDELPQDMPAPALKKRKKRRTELENLEITLKGWNMMTSVSQALLFTRNPAQPDKMVMYGKAAADGLEEGDRKLFGEREDEDADKEFNFVKNDDDLEEMYLL